MASSMKHMEELKRCVNVTELRFYLDYNIMIAEMMAKRGLDTGPLQEEKEVLERRIAQLMEEE